MTFGRFLNAKRRAEVIELIRHAVQKRKRSALVAVLLVLGVVGGIAALTFGNADSAYIALARSAVKDQLIDPESAIFRSDAVFQRGDDWIEICGAVNAKNSFGGYVGFRYYVARIKNGVVVSLHILKYPSPTPLDQYC
jgi:hypothetical protein